MTPSVLEPCEYEEYAILRMTSAFEATVTALLGGRPHEVLRCTRRFDCFSYVHDDFPLEECA
jgi:hypothetical protein